MSKTIISAVAAAFLSLIAVPSQAKTLCTLVIEVETERVVHDQGDCDEPVTPASTFKVPLALMGFDSGILSDAKTPVLPFRKGDPDWGGANWQRDTNPQDWMHFSVLWYSERIAQALGQQRLGDYAQSFGFGNADFSGDAGHTEALWRSWVSSSLKISPRQQAEFLRNLVQESLPVSPRAMKLTKEILDVHDSGGWTLHGKTGGAYPRRADRSFDYAKGWGWYVGWAEKGGETLIFVRLTQATQRSKTSPGILTRDGLLEDWPRLAGN